MNRKSIASMQGSKSSLPLLSNPPYLRSRRYRRGWLRYASVSGGHLSILTPYAPHGGMVMTSGKDSSNH